MAGYPLSLHQVARFIEEVQWGIASSPVMKNEVPFKSLSKNKATGDTDELPQRLGVARSVPKKLAGMDVTRTLSWLGILGRRRLTQVLPWMGLGLAIAVMDPKVSGAIALGSTLGWTIWQLQTQKHSALIEALRQRVAKVGIKPAQRQWMGAITSGSFIALSTYGGFALWENFHSGWLVAGVVGQSGLMVGMAWVLWRQNQQHQEAQAVERFHHLLERLFVGTVQERSVIIQQLLWLSWQGRLDAYQQGMVLQALQGLFMVAADGAGVDKEADKEKEMLSAAIAQFQQSQTLHQTAASPMRVLSGSALGEVQTPLGYPSTVQREQVTQGQYPFHPQP